MFTHVAFYNETYREMMVKHGMIVCISECMVDFYYAEEISKCCEFAGDNPEFGVGTSCYLILWH